MVTYLASGRNIEDLLLHWARAHGPFYEFRLPGTPPVLVVSDPEAVKEVYELRQYPKSPRYADLLPLLGAQSMVVTEGAVWRAQRDAFNPGFSSSFLRSALPEFIGCTQHMMDALGAAADRQETVLLHELAILTATEVICKVGFGEDTQLFTRGLNDPLWNSFRRLGEHVAWYLDNIPLNFLKNMPWNAAKCARLQQELEQHLTAILRKRLAAAGISEASLSDRPAAPPAPLGAGAPASAAAGCPMHSAAAAAAAAAAADDAAPGPVPASDGTSSGSSSGGGASASGSSGGAEQCPFLPASTAAAAAPAPGRASSGSGSGDFEDSFGGGGASFDVGAVGGARDILSLALELSVRDGALDREQLLSQMKTFFAAGHDTTASLVAWAVYFLCQHPAAESRLRAEVDGAMGEAGQPTHQQLSDMRFLGCVLKETLRVRPPVSVLARYAPEGSSLAGYCTSDTVLLVSPYILHVDPAVWGEDAALWRPERWEDEQGVAANVPAYSYMPFSRGPRDCIGARFALLEAKTILAMLYSRFDVRYVGRQAEQVMMSITAHPKHGVPVRVTRRQRQQHQQQQGAAAAAAVGEPAVAAAVPASG